MLLRSGDPRYALDEKAFMGEETVRIFFQQSIKYVKLIFGSQFFNGWPTVGELHHH